MEVLLIVILLLLLVLIATVAVLVWFLFKKKPDQVQTPSPEDAFKDFKKLMGDNDPNAELRMEQIQKCIYYSPDQEERNEVWNKTN